MDIEVCINAGDVERLFDAIHDEASAGRNSNRKVDKNQALDRILGMSWAGWRMVNTKKVEPKIENEVVE